MQSNEQQTDFNFFYRYHSRKLYIIDVSQSVEHDHPHASEFLRKDLSNVTDYFAKKGVRVMSIMELFKFVTDVSFSNEDTVVDARLEHIQEEMNANPNLEINTIEDEIFMKSYIPTTLDEVIDIDRDTLIVEEGGGGNLVYADLLGTGVTKSMKQLEIESDQEEDESKSDDSDEDSNDEDNSDDDSEDENGERKPRVPRGKKNEDKDDKKDRKKKTKEEARERRKHKLPKAEKKRKIKTSCKKKK